MFTPAYLFLYFIIFCVSAAIGGFVERLLKGRSAPPPPRPTPDNKTLANEGDIEVLSAWRTGSNKLWLEMDGKRLENKDALQPEQRQRLLNLLLDLRPWLEAVRPAASAPVVAPQPVQPAAPALAVTPQPTQPAAPAPAVILLPVQAEKEAGTPGSGEAKPAPVPDSIIQQIDKVLQARLATSPLKDRDIQLVEGPGGIVIVKDGLNKYEGVDAIPDLEIKALIRQAVADWEKGTK